MESDRGMKRQYYYQYDTNMTARQYGGGRTSPEGHTQYGNREARVVDTPLMSERVQIERKQFFFDLKENASGRFLKITEDVCGHRDTIIIPSTGLEMFRDTIDRAIVAERDMN